MARDEYYQTKNVDVESHRQIQRAKKRYKRYSASVHKQHGDMVFGQVWCVAVRVLSEGRGSAFLCSPRRRVSPQSLPVMVTGVDHEDLVVYMGRQPGSSSSPPASLSAPLLDRIFETFPDVIAVIHIHQTGTGLNILPYATPGTARDSQRQLINEDFEIEHHGTFTLMRDGGP